VVFQSGRKIHNDPQRCYLGQDETEQNESNNASRAVAVTCARADLVARYVQVSDANVTPGETITVDWQAWNRGGEDSGRSR
jgi:hypothetical protein